MTVRSGFRTAWRFAGPPTRTPPFVKARRDGNIFPPYALPSALGIIRGVPPSMYAASELVVPRSIPIILAIRFTSVLDNNYLSGTQDAIVEPIPLPDDLLHGSVLPLRFRHLLDAIHLVRIEDPPLGGNLLQAGVVEGPRQVVADHPDPFSGLAVERCPRGVHLVEDGQQAGNQEFVGELHDRLRIAVRPLAVVLELRLKILQLRHELLILAAQFGEFVARRGLLRLGGGGLLVLLVLERGRLLFHLMYLASSARDAPGSDGARRRPLRCGTSRWRR